MPSLSTKETAKVQPETLGKTIEKPAQGFDRKNVEAMMRGLKDELVGLLSFQQAQIDYLKTELAIITVVSSSPSSPGCLQAPGEVAKAQIDQLKEATVNEVNVSSTLGSRGVFDDAGWLQPPAELQTALTLRSPGSEINLDDGTPKSIFLRMCALEKKVNCLLQNFNDQVTVLEEHGAKLLQVKEFLQTSNGVIFADGPQTRQSGPNSSWFISCPEKRSSGRKSTASQTRNVDSGRKTLKADFDVNDFLHDPRRVMDRFWCRKTQGQEDQDADDHEVYEESADTMKLELCGGFDADVVSVDFWAFGQTVWDAAAFAGHSGMLLPVEAFSVLMFLLVNVLVQVCFVIIVWNSLSESSLNDDTMDGFHRWRTNTAHSAQFMDRLTLESLSSRVCRGDSSLHMSEGHAEQVQGIDAYLNNNQPFNGPLMCFLALLTWTLTVSKEFQGLKSMFAACRCIPRGQTVVAMDERGRLYLLSLGYVRAGYFLFLGLCRAMIASVLLVAGAKFLIVTLSIEDILLNTVALEFILNVDELLYLALAPIKTRRLICLLRPLRTKRSTALNGVDTNIFLTTIFIVGFQSTAVVVWMLPEMERMRDAKHELCAGNLDFSYAFNEANFLIWGPVNGSGVTLDPHQIANQDKATTWYKVLRSIIDESFDHVTDAHGLRLLQGPGWTVANFGDWGIDQVGRTLNPTCIDLLPGLGRDALTAIGKQSRTPNTDFHILALASLRDKFRNQSISTCADVASHCSRYSSSVVRMWCPRTCGCNSFGSTLAVPYPHDGCPASCVQSVPFQDERAAAPCVELDQNTLVSIPSWTEYVANRVLVASEWSEVATIFFNNIARLMMVHGCGAYSLAKHRGYDICRDEQSLKNVAVWCPVTCRCNESNTNIFCPSKCTAWAPAKTAR